MRKLGQRLVTKQQIFEWFLKLDKQENELSSKIHR